MKQKRKNSDLPLWVRPLLTGRAPSSLKLYLNIIAGGIILAFVLFVTFIIFTVPMVDEWF